MKEINNKSVKFCGPTLYLASGNQFVNAWTKLVDNELHFYKSVISLTFSKMFSIKGAKIIGSPTDEPILYTERAGNRCLFKLEIVISQQKTIKLFIQ